ncbi:hypothetical protein [Diaphorobacter sp.]|uniref:hypothetical protein n=1 Tax=Diaphorobacter sp. TaxID=1934310 RepID=UPI00258C1068|nr:hypothetical protein [Diaphorobacter sp.]
MNRSNVQAALDDEGVQSLADECHAAMRKFADALGARDFILAAVQRAETEGECSLARVTSHLTQQLAGFVLAARDVEDYNAAFAQWLATDGNELGEVRPPPINFQ